MKKSLISRIWYGIKSGWQLPSLPDHIIKIDRNLYVRIFKGIGAVCVFLIFNATPHQYPKPYFYIIFLFSFLYSLYRLVLVIYSIKQFFLLFIYRKINS